MSKHTPGPWIFGLSNRNNEAAIIGDIDSVVCFLPDASSGCTFKPADARLIAKAPELLDMLIQCRKEFAGLPHSLGYDFTHLPKLDALIAEATGDA